MKLGMIALCLTLLGFSLGCDDDKKASEETDADMEESFTLTSDRAHLRDSDGRAVMLRGVNARVNVVFDLEFDDGRVANGVMPDFGAEDAASMRRLGINVLRLPINWSGVEPTQGTYDEAYLDKVEAIVDLCAAAGIYVVIDFHQDAYSKEIGEDGAPLWAIQPAPAQLLEGPITEDELAKRRSSDAVFKAFATFFNDTDADTTDVMLQGAFAAMAKHVAKRFVDQDYVAGYDLFNEPITFTPSEVFRFNDRITAAIREVDSDKLIFFEPTAYRVLSGSTETAGPFGDARGVYSPHLYTFSFDGDELGSYTSRDQLTENVTNALSEASDWDTPLFVGEWGVNPTWAKSPDYIDAMLDMFDANFVHSAVWLWKENSQGLWGFHDYDADTGAWTVRQSAVDAFVRPFAQSVAGTPSNMSLSDDGSTLTVEFEGLADVTDSAIYLPETFASGYTATCDGSALADLPARDTNTGLVSLECGGTGTHTLVVALLLD